MFKLALNAGHAKNTAGKRCKKSIDPAQTREWVLNSRICNKIEEKLSKYTGIEVLRIDDPTGQKDLSVAQRAKKANAFGADLYLSVHHNAGINGGSGGGIVAYTYLKVSEKTKNWQKELYDAAIKYTGLKGNRANPLAKKNLGECRRTKMPAVLMECGFMDSTTDTPVILTEEFAEQTATAFTEVIVRFSSAVLTTQSTVKKPASGELYRVRKTFEDKKSQVGAFRILANAINKAKSTGCNVYDTNGNCVWQQGDK